MPGRSNQPSAGFTGAGVGPDAELNAGGRYTSRLMGGVVVVALVVGGSRWASQIGVPPLYVCDLLLLASVVHLLLTRSKRGALPTLSFDGSVPSRAPTIFVGLLAAYAIVRGTIAVPDSPSIVDWGRDLVPYLYSLVGYIAAYALATSTPGTRKRTMKVLYCALVFHLVWVAVGVLTKNIDGIAVGSVFNVNIFKVRNDFDGILIAVLVGLCVKRWVVGPHRTWAFVGMMTGVFTVLNMASRAALLALLTAVLLGAMFAYVSSESTRQRRLLMVGSAPLALLLSGVALAATTPGQRLLASVNPDLAVTDAQRNALGTMSARETAWDLIFDWVGERGFWVLFGSGFGNNFLEQSGSLQILQGTEYEGVRSPHNYLVGTYARLGIFGLVLVLFIFGQVVSKILASRHLIASDDLLVFSAISACAILPPAIIGVVLEAPFGAILFFWCVGIITALPVRERAVSARRYGSGRAVL